MTVLDELRVTCVIMDKTTVADGYGGVITTWTDGAEFLANVHEDTASPDVRAQQLATASVYTIVTDSTVVLNVNDVIKRVSDGKLIRITRDSKESRVPQYATMQKREVQGVAWSNG